MPPSLQTQRPQRVSTPKKEEFLLPVFKTGVLGGEESFDSLPALDLDVPMVVRFGTEGEEIAKKIYRWVDFLKTTKGFKTDNVVKGVGEELGQSNFEMAEELHKKRGERVFQANREVILVAGNPTLCLIGHGAGSLLLPSESELDMITKHTPVMNFGQIPNIKSGFKVTAGKGKKGIPLKTRWIGGGRKQGFRGKKTPFRSGGFSIRIIFEKGGDDSSEVLAKSRRRTNKANLRPVYTRTTLNPSFGLR